ncbi:DUF488 family protein [Prevotella corporis]
MIIRLKRIYEQPEDTDGFRVLTDRLWPRGISKEKAKLDLWAANVAPRHELRKWFGHDSERYDDFKQRYLLELEENGSFNDFLTSIERHEVVTLLFGAHDGTHNNAVVLKEKLESILQFNIT